MSKKKVAGATAAGAVAAAVLLTFAPTDEAQDSRVGAVDAAMAKASDPNSGALDGLSDAERELLASPTATSVLLDARTGAVLSVEKGNVVPVGAAHR